MGLGAAAAASVALAGCGGSGATTSAASSAAAPAGGAPMGTNTPLQFVTGGESGTYYAFGSVIAQHATNNAGVNLNAVAGNGSQANVQELQDGISDLAFCQSDVEAYAYEGTNLFAETGAVDCFSTVACLYDEQVQIVTCDETIKTVEDLKGKNVSIGAAGSGVYFNAIDILGAYGLSESDINPTYQSFADSADALRDGKIDAAFVVAGVPTPAIVELANSKDIYLISLDQEHVDKLKEISPAYTEVTIPAGSYSSQKEEVLTVGMKATIIANTQVTEEQAYTIVKTIFEGKDDLAAAHAKGAELDLEYASVCGIPYHPGAAKYFEEQGITVETANP